MSGQHVAHIRLPKAAILTPKFGEILKDGVYVSSNPFIIQRLIGLTETKLDSKKPPIYFTDRW